jgi:hypothetical protein
MWGGGAFSAAWNGATNAAKTTAALIATGVKKIVGAAEAVGAEVVKDAKIAAHAVAEAEQWAEKKTIQGAKWAEKQAIRGEKWAEKKTIQAAKWVEAEAIAAAVASAAAAVVAMDAVETVFSDVVAGAEWVACAAVNQGIKEVGTVLGAISGTPAEVLLPKKPRNLPHDGETVGDGCKKKTPNSTGMLPKCEKGLVPRIRDEHGQIRKVTYINGIMTDYATICKTMQKLANATCAEVTGVYNATGGIWKDLQECLANMGNNSVSRAGTALQNSMNAALSQEPAQDMTIYAHSQGGLITQEALRGVKNDLTLQYGVAGAEARMKHLTVKSFGTAEEGWPAGPNYEQFTNLSDAVPGAIAGAQLNHPIDTFADNATISLDDQHYFMSPRWTPVAGSHSIDDVYIPEYIEEMKKKGQPTCCA